MTAIVDGIGFNAGTAQIAYHNTEVDLALIRTGESFPELEWLMKDLVGYHRLKEIPTY